LHALGAKHFTTGLNAYLFALAATTRTFHSNFAKILSGKK